MWNNNKFNFNPKSIEKRLSPFGKQVLNTLIKQWNSEDDRKKYNRLLDQRYNVRARNKVNDVYTSNTRQITFDSMGFEENVNDDKTHEYSASESNHIPGKVLKPKYKEALPTTIPTSADLVDTDKNKGLIVPASYKDENNICRENLIATIYDTQNPGPRHITKNLVHEIYGTSVNENFSLFQNDDNFVRSEIKITGNNNENVGWENMFDTELFLEENERISKINEEQDATKVAGCTEKMFHIKFPKKSNEECKKVGKKHNTQKIKRKNSAKEPIEITKPKKLKSNAIKSGNVKDNMRKMKNTKAVKNWLNEVDPNNKVEEDEIKHVIVETEQFKIQDTTKISKTSELREKDLIKVVQSQLTNKGGIMKYGRPKKTIHNDDTLHETEKDNLIEDTSGIEITCQIKSKEKKGKPKFVAPIKSQLPVKDIKYDVRVIHEGNAGDYLFLKHVVNKEVVAILKYSNGFCQLNRHYTDDDCEPNAVLCFIGDTYYIFKGTGDNIANYLETIMKNNTILCYDGKVLFVYLMSQHNLEFVTSCKVFDAKIAGCLLEPDAPPENFTELQKIASYDMQFTVCTECSMQKAAWYTSTLAAVCSNLKTLLLDNKLWEVFQDIEMKLLPIIAEMENRGILVDQERIKRMDNLLQRSITTVEGLCHAAAGKSFLVGSAHQLRVILYDELKLDTKLNVKVRETVTIGAKSTSDAMLRQLSPAHPLPGLVAHHRRLTRVRVALKLQLHDGLVKPTWIQTAAATGRIACCNPNLQAVPRGSVGLRPAAAARARGDPDSDGNSIDVGEDGPESVCPRSAFVCGAGAGACAGAGRVLLAADFRHVECRVLACAAADSTLQRALHAHDLFTELAAMWLQKSQSSVSADERERTKRIVYANMYGAGAAKLMDILQVDYSRAKDIAASFHRTFPALKSFGEKIAEECSAHGGVVRSLCGRARRLPPTAETSTSEPNAARAHALRQALNFVVQGTAADLCKLAMIDCWEALHNDPSLGRRAGAGARLLLQIHDELLWDLPREHLHLAAGIIKRAMEGCGARAGLPSLPVSLSVGDDWGSLKPYNIEEGPN